VVDVLFYPWCGGCLVWWMSGVVDVCVVDVVQSHNCIYLQQWFTYSCIYLQQWLYIDRMLWSRMQLQVKKETISSPFQESSAGIQLIFRGISSPKPPSKTFRGFFKLSRAICSTRSNIASAVTPPGPSTELGTLPPKSQSSGPPLEPFLGRACS